MQEERLHVLRMVDEGKITVDEATKLLESMRQMGAPQGPGFEEKFKDFAHDMKVFCKDVGSKINHMYKEAEPKVKEFTKSVVSKTANLADNISQSLNERVKKMGGQAADCGCECECNCEEPPADNGPRPE